MSPKFQQAIEIACLRVNKNDFYAKCLIRGTEKWQSNEKSKSFAKSDAIQKQRAITALEQVGMTIVHSFSGARLTALISGVDDYGNQIYETHNGFMIAQNLKNKQRVVEY